MKARIKKLGAGLPENIINGALVHAEQKQARGLKAGRNRKELQAEIIAEVKTTFARWRELQQPKWHVRNFIQPANTLFPKKKNA